ncbi:MAG: hypothetical protein P4L28_08670 [Paludibacteraceae bacterium]|nr:hypothetical protein [Paludibacteraceae bacterium]
MKKKAITIIFLVITVAGFAQDYIVKKDGNRIDCKVTKEDSANVYITMDLGGKEVNAYINRKEIQYIKFGNTQTKSIGNTTTATNTATTTVNTTTRGWQRNRISFNIGGSFPMDGSESLTNENMGSAKTGGKFDISYKNFYSPTVGFGVKMYGLINPLGNDKMDNYLFTSKSTSGNWYSWGILGGVCLESKTENNTAFSFDLFTGLMSLRPEIQQSMDGQSTSLITKAALSSGWNFGVGISQPISKHCSIALSVDYLYSNFKFNDYIINETETVKMNILNLTCGLIFGLDENY